MSRTLNEMMNNNLLLELMGYCLMFAGVYYIVTIIERSFEKKHIVVKKKESGGYFAKAERLHKAYNPSQDKLKQMEGNYEDQFGIKDHDDPYEGQYKE